MTRRISFSSCENGGKELESNQAYTTASGIQNNGKNESKKTSQTHLHAPLLHLLSRSKLWPKI
jgi:hypothetical protein